MKKLLPVILLFISPLPALAGSTQSPGGTPVTRPTAEDEKAAILDVLDEQQRAMVEGDITALNAVLDEDYTATHITGYRQPRAEWLAQMESGYFKYHRVTPQNSTVRVNGTQATAVRRSIIDVTISSSRGSWQLETTTQLEKKDHQWKIVNSRSVTY